MLRSLHIENLAIIDKADVELGKGLNIMTGETGAGKSVIIGSVSAALGGKLSKDMIRNGSDSAMVELCFETDDKKVADKLSELSLPENAGEVLISRRISSSGKTVLRVNGEQAGINDVRELAGMLINIHGQRENMTLLSAQSQLKLVDTFAGKPAAEQAEKVSCAFSEYKMVLDELNEATLNDDERMREISFLEYALNEIDGASLKAGEEEELSEKYRKLSNLKAIKEGLSEVYSLTAGSLSDDADVAAAEKISMAQKVITRISGFDERISEFLRELSQVQDILDTFNRDVADYLEDAEENDEFDNVSKRLDIIRALDVKYGGTIEKVLDYRDECSAKLEKYRDYDEYKKKLSSRLKKKEAELADLSSELTEIRKKAAAELSLKIRKALENLNFLQGLFEIRIDCKNKFSASGTDNAAIFISTNPGQPMQPLEKIASGGELSRIMLAIKSVFADKNDIEALVFDEIDTGISGHTAEKVAETLTNLALGHQIICITHLPQIAAMADKHFVIEKHIESGTTKTCIRELLNDGMVDELMRLTSGAKVTESLRNNAVEMKKSADEYKLTRKK
jgi:DNA repair protein RecN (Recombination protein N)